jgi:N-acetylglucosamine-6-phosphate deacetylase
METADKLFTNAQIYVPGGLLKGASLYVKNGRIERIFSSEENCEITAEEVVDVQGANMVPGFVDVHVHGGGGFDVMSGNPQDINGMSLFHASKGTTSFLATTLTHHKSAIEKAIEGIVKAMEEGSDGAEVAGIHLEGPFLNKAHCGAQNPEHIRGGTLEELQSYIDLSKGNVRLMTIAPEQKDAMEVIKLAVKQGITISLGHSDATYDIVQQSVQAGASHVTHLFNGMRGLHHREPGLAGSALMMDDLAVELICDGFHVHRELVSYVFRVKPREQIVLITDCISAAGCSDGEYELGSLPVILKNGLVRLKTADHTLGSLAGSSLTMDQALRNTIEYTELSLEQILPTLTINPARQIGLEHRKGSIERGKDADLVILDHQNRVKSTYVQGRRVYESGIEA